MRTTNRSSSSGFPTSSPDPLTLYDDSDVAFLDEVDENEDFGDPCHEFEHSVFFFIILACSFVTVVCYCVLLAKRRMLLTGYDILYLLLFFFAFVRFGPKMWGALQIHGVHHASQSGCKLVAYTEFGLRHVNVFLVCCLVLYAWLAVKCHRDDLDCKIRKHFPWLLLLLFALQGVTGMAPAIYTDVDFSGTRCDFARSEELSLAQFLAGQIILSTLLPYVVPFAALAYPLYSLSKAFLDVEEQPLRAIVRNILIVAWTHILLSLPWSLHALVMLPLLQGWTVGLDAVTVCIVDGVFRIVLELWYLVVPITVIVGDPVLGKDLPGSGVFWAGVNGVRNTLYALTGRRF